MNDPYLPTRWQCWLCGFAITPVHDPFALKVRFTNLHKDETRPTTPWHDVFAHAECVSERMPKGACFDPEALAEDLDVEDLVDLADNHAACRVDFNLYNGLGSGLTLGLAGGDEAGREGDAIHMKEAAFAVVEFCIEQRWPKYAEGGHYGLSKIASPVWLQIVDSLNELKCAMASADSVSDIGDLYSYLERKISSELLAEIDMNLAGVKRGIVMMIIDLRAYLRCWCETHPFIYVHGV
jgi:hypothetical protein